LLSCLNTDNVGTGGQLFGAAGSFIFSSAVAPSTVVESKAVEPSAAVESTSILENAKSVQLKSE